MISSRDAMTKRRKPTSNHQSLLCLAPVEVERFRQVVFCPVRTIADVVQIPGRKLQSIFGLGFFLPLLSFFLKIISCSLFLLPWAAQDGSKTFASYFRHLPFPLPLQFEFFHVAVMSKVKPSRRGWPCHSLLGRRCQTPPARQCSLETNTSQVLGNCGSFSPPLPLLVGYELTMSSSFLM